MSKSRLVLGAGVGLAIACLALSPYVSGAYIPLKTFKLCDPNELFGKECDNPGNCINACAAKCSSWTSCKQCCTQFAVEPEDYLTCKNLCREVHDPNAVAEP